MKTSFFLSLTPPTCTSQQKGQRIITGRSGKSFVSHYKKKPLKEAENTFKALLKEHIPSSPIEGAIRVTCEWVFPWRKSELKRVTKKYSRIPKTSKPDAANSNKLLIDCMTETGFWADDSLVFSEKSEKYWGNNPGINITIEHGEGLGFTERADIEALKY